MRIPRIFENQPLAEGMQITLAEDTSHRLSTVLRLKTGNVLLLFNGDGDEYRSVIQGITRNRVEVSIVEKIVKNLESSLNIHLGQGISKGEKMDFVIQKATELGVQKITPLFSTRSVVHLRAERLERKIDQLRKIAIHAAEQCGRTVIPIIEKPLPLTEWIDNRSESTRLILDPISLTPLTHITLLDPIALCIGPEGGLTEEERHYAMQSGFQSVRLGPRVLRTETATLAALTVIQYHAGDLGQ